MTNKLKTFYNDFIKFPSYVLFHPFDGFYDFKFEKKGKFKIAVLFIALFAILRVLEIQYVGFVVRDYDPTNLNSFKEIIAVLIVLALFVVGNWSVTTLMNGKGNMKQIFMVTGYSLMPIVFIGYPAIIISNVIGFDEVGFYQILIGISYFGTFWMLFTGLLNIHEYGLGKTIGAILFTLAAMLLMVFIGLLFFDLLQQFIGFLSMIWKEINLRY